MSRGLDSGGIPGNTGETSEEHRVPVTPDSSPNLRRLSVGGLLAMVVGLGLCLIEWTTGFIQGRLGPFGHYTILGCGILFSIWGLKELLSAWWPHIGRNGLVRNRFHIPLEGWAFLLIMFVLFIGSLLGRSNPLMLVFSMMAGAFVMNGWMTFTFLRSVSVRRELPERAMSGETFSVGMTLVNKKTWLSAWLMTVEDIVVGPGTELHPEVVYLRVPADQEQQGHYQLVLTQRGVYRFGPIHVDTRFPLGLVERGLNLSLSTTLKVHPRLGRLSSQWRRQLDQANEQTTSQAARGGIFHDEFHSLREYRAGDDVRAVHWRTSARRNELMVREYRDSRDRSLLILLDAWLPAKVTPALADDFERALGFIATACVETARTHRDSRITLGAQGATLALWRGGSGGQKIEDLLDHLAELLPATNGDLASLLEQTAPDRSQQPRILMLTARLLQVRKELEQRLPLDHSLASIQLLEIGTDPFRSMFEPLESGEINAL